MRTIDHHIINGVVQVNGIRFIRIDDLSSNATGFEFINKPAALVRIDDSNPEAAWDLARAVCDAMNAVEGAE